MRFSKLTGTAIALIAICALGLGLRAVKVVEPNPVPGDDAHAYFALATSLYEDGTFGGPDFNNASDWSPGAPLLYAGMFHLTGGPREGSIRALQALLGLGSILLAFVLARRLARSSRASRVGLLAAGAVALYPPFIHSTGATMSEPLALFLLLATVVTMIWARDRAAPEESSSPRGLASGTWAWAVAGLLVGLLALTRPEYLAVAMLFVFVVAWTAGESQIRRGLAASLAFFLALLVPIVPWTIHNVSTLDRLVPVSTGSGKALYVGTFMPGDGDYQRTKAILVRDQLGLDLEPGSAELDAVDPRPLFDQVASRYPDLRRDDALGRIGRQQLEMNLRDRPFEYVSMTARKVWRMWSNGQGGAMKSIPARAIQVALVLLGLAGLVALLRRRRIFEAVVCAVPIATITAVGAITLASDRRGQVLMGIVLALAAVAVSEILARLRPEPPLVD